MRYDFSLAWRNIRNRPVQAAVPIIVVALAIALSVSVIVTADSAQEGIVQASDPFGMLVVGRAGSGQELVLSSVLLQGTPIGNIPYDVYQQLEDDDERVRVAVPLAFGDNVAGARLVGTNSNFLELRTSQQAPPAFQITEGRWLDDDASFEAVLGWDAARRTGLAVGDQFRSIHGVGRGIAENEHEDIYTIVGIFGRSYTAYDTAVYTQLESIWDAHGHDDEHADDEHDDEHADDEHDDEHADDEHDDEHADDEHDDEHADDEHDDGVAASAPIQLVEAGAAASADEVTAVLVLPTGFVEQNQLAQEYYLNPLLQAAFPGGELSELIGLLNQGQQVLNVIGYLVLVIAGLTVFLSMYSAILARRQDIAIMRSLGSSRVSVFRVILFETLLVSIIGALIGRLLGYGLAAIIGATISQANALPMPLRFLWDLEIILWGLSIGVGLLAGLIPAWLAYRVDIVKNLFPS